MKILKIFSSLFFLAFMFFACKKDDEKTTDELKCANDAEFCGLINQDQLTETNTPINNYLAGLDSGLSDQVQIERLKDWLNCKSCVANAQIICVSCIETLPPQSELRIRFVVNGVQREKVLDVSMSRPLKFGGYHD